jgi:FkbM family methyltransferase
MSPPPAFDTSNPTQPQTPPQAQPGLAERARRFVRDALPRSLSGLLTLRANPLLGLAFRLTGRRLQSDGLSFQVPTKNSRWSELATYWFDTYENSERALAARYIRPEERVLELGGCLGVVSCSINRLLENPNRHVVVEANPELLAYLYKNRRRNKAQFVIEHAVVGVHGAQAVARLDGTLTSSFTSVTEVPRADMIVTRSLAELCAKHGDFTCLVMDIEGAEYGVLTGEREAWEGMRLVILELHPTLLGAEHTQACRDVLRAAGLECRASIPGGSHVVEAWVRPEITSQHETASRA